MSKIQFENNWWNHAAVLSKLFRQPTPTQGRIQAGLWGQSSPLDESKLWSPGVIQSPPTPTHPRLVPVYAPAPEF